MAALTDKPDVEVREISPDEGKALFDRAARHYLRMSGEEFIRAWDAGIFKSSDEPDVMAVAMLLPFAR